MVGNKVCSPEAMESGRVVRDKTWKRNDKPKIKPKHILPAIPLVTDTGRLVYGSYITTF